MPPSPLQERQRLAERLTELLAVHQPRARLGEHRLLAGRRRQLVELGQHVPPIVLLARRPLDLIRDRDPRLLRLAPALVGGARGHGRGLEPAIGVEQAALGRGVEQRLLLVLAVDLDQQVAELAEQPAAHRLVVDEGARAAVGGEHPAQHQIVPGIDAVLGQQGRYRRLAGRAEDRADRRLRGTRADQLPIRPAAERQPERVEQDRLAGAGLAGQHAQPALELEVEALDQDDVADREAGQHGAGRRVSGGRPRAPSRSGPPSSSRPSPSWSHSAAASHGSG